MPHLRFLRLASAQPVACFSRCEAFSLREALDVQGSWSLSTGFNHSLIGISRSQRGMHKVRKIPCMKTLNSLSSWPPYLRFWYIWNRRGSRKANFLHSRSCRMSGAAFAELIVCRSCMSLGVDMTCFSKEERDWSLTNRWSLVLSYVVRVRRNHTIGSNLTWRHTCIFLGVPCRRLADLPRFWSFEDAEFPLEVV